MKISVILAHPNPKSFNHAIYQEVLETLKNNGYNINAHNLYEEEFKPLLEGSELANGETSDPLVLDHRQEIKKAQGIIIIHPNWWGQPPAILKGWVDRVIRPGVAYEFLEGDSGEGVPNGLLKAKATLVYNTSNTKTRREKEVFGDPLETIWKNCIFGLCGITNFHRRMFNVIVTSTEKQRKIWLNHIQKDIHFFFPDKRTKGGKYGGAK